MCSFTAGRFSIAQRCCPLTNKLLVREKSQPQQKLGLPGGWRSSTCCRIITSPDPNRVSTAGASVISLSIQSATCSPARLHHRQFPICVLKMFGLAGSIGFGANRKVLHAFAARNGCPIHPVCVGREKSTSAVAVVGLRCGQGTLATPT